MQNSKRDGVEMMLWQQCNPKYKYMQDFQYDCCSTDTGMENFCTMMVSICIISKEYSISYQEITSTMYDFVNGCTVCMTFCSWMRLSLTGMLLPKQGIHTLGHMKIHLR
jgi:hypothetical protein